VDLRRALEQGHASNARHAAHTLKSTSANLGAWQLSAQCAQLERLIRADQISQARESFALAELSYREAEVQLQALRRTLDAENVTTSP
nr:Hpt domain-containing protein [Burkholderiaceae bacterium]